ncbi:hypothetical protein [Rhizobium sp. BK068]|uniref:hypothetical protein n=1 Tax=Rhizobium sp. BK068 TaxID=2512130 RepID=UPI0010434241|nr:hypothetical protein [Rhizobium sp. BK068]
MSIQDFLNTNPELNRGEDDFRSATDVNLSVVVRGISNNTIDFVYMGQSYKVERKDVVDLEEIKNSSLGPKSATITLNRDAVLLVQRAVSAIDIANSTPFGFEKLSPAFAGDNVRSARENAWLRSIGYSNDEEFLPEAGASRSFSTSTSCPRPTRDDERADTYA